MSYLRVSASNPTRSSKISMETKLVSPPDLTGSGQELIIHLGHTAPTTTILLFLLPGPSGAIEANSLRDNPSHHPHQSHHPNPRSFVPLPLARCARRLVARTSPAERWGRGSSGVHSLVPCCLVRCVPPELGCSHRKVGHGSTGTQRYRLLPFVCCSARCAPPELGRAPPTGGAVGVRVHNGAFCFAPCVRLPPLVCSQQ